MIICPPPHKLLSQGMGVGKASTLQQKVTPLATPARNAV